MIPILSLIAIAIVAWRLRRVLGGGQRWNDAGREQASHLARRLGWTDGEHAPGRVGPRAESTPTRHPPHRSFFPEFDSRRLPAALGVGAIEAIVVLGLDGAGYSFLSLLTAIVVGPFLGGTYVRSLWWPLVAALVAIVVGAGELGTTVIAVPVVAIGYAGVRADIAGWLARLNTEPEEPPARPRHTERHG